MVTLRAAGRQSLRRRGSVETLRASARLHWCVTSSARGLDLARARSAHPEKRRCNNWDTRCHAQAHSAHPDPM